MNGDPNITIGDVYKLLKTLENKIDATNKAIEDIQADLNITKNKCIQLEVENCKLKNTIVNIENRNRRNNIIVFGLPKEDITVNYITTLSKVIEIDLQLNDINNIHYIGKPQKDKNNPIKIEFISYLKKIEILQNAYKLKGKNIFITHDLSKEDQKINKELRQYLNKAKQKKIKATIKKNKLIVNNKEYTLAQLTEQPDAIFEEGDLEEVSEEEHVPKEKKRKEQHKEDMSKKNPLDKQLRKATRSKPL